MSLWLIITSYGPLNLLAVNVIDIDNFKFPKAQVKGVRCVSFDTDTQEYKRLDYFVQPTPANFESTFLGIMFDSDCNINVSATFELENFIIKTKGKITIDDLDSESSPEWVIQKVTDFTNKGDKVERNLLSHGKIKMRRGSFIMKTLNKKAGKRKGSQEFKATFHKSREEEKKPFSLLSSDSTDNKDERGILGELATHLTMLSFGYDSHYSKYGTNNGFDGVFLDDSREPELFITESKCKERADGVEIILRDGLSEKTTVSKLHHIFNDTHKALSDEAKDLLQNTGRLIKDYISKSPNRIFKFAHRIKPDGTCQCLVDKFDLKEYNAALLPTLSPQSPDRDKVVALNGLMKQLCNSEEKKVALLLRSIGKPKKEKLKLIFGGLQIPDDQQEEIYKILDLEAKDVKKTLNFSGSFDLNP